MDHKLFRSKISEYMDKKLSAKELAEFDTHAKACPECLLELQMTVKAVKELKRSPQAKEQELPVNFYAKLGVKLDAADTEKQKRKSFIYTPWFKATAMSFALVMIVVMVRQITKSPEFMGNKGIDRGAQQEAEMAAGPAEAPPGGVVGKRMYNIVAVTKPDTKEKKQVKYEAKAKTAAPAKMDVKNVDVYEGTTLNDISQDKMPAAAPAPALRYSSATTEHIVGAQLAADPDKDEKLSMNYRPDLKLGVVDSWGAKKDEVKKNYEGTQSGVEVFQALAFTDVKAWNQFAAKYPALNTVTVDFNTEMIVSVFLGTKPTAGYNVMITDVFYETDKVMVKYIETSPNKGTLQAQVITTPYSMKVVKKSPLRVQFERQ